MDGTDACDISVIVPHYNDLRNLDNCLGALMAQDIGPDTRVEIIVADNGTPPGLDTVCEVVAGRAHVVLAPERGAGPARNAGVKVANGRILAFIDSDCVAEPGWLRGGLAALDNHDFVGGRVTVLVHSESRMNGVEAFERIFAFDNGAYIAKKGFTVTANLFCPAATFAAVGPFRQTVSEDVEWARRATGKGFRLGYAPQAVVGHPAREDWPTLLRKWRRINRETYALWRDEGQSRLRWIARTWLLPVSTLPHTVKAMRSHSLSGAGNRLRAIGTLAAHRLWRFWDQHRLMLEPQAVTEQPAVPVQARAPTKAG